ncbi:MAG TPA: hypothetical protein VGI79_20455 [Caulobacteraceae bacterium]|jgi:hypothetical protein
MEVRNRVFLELSLASVSGIIFLATLLWPAWIEFVFHIDPDAGRGDLERAIVIITAATTVTCSLIARLEWRKRRLATGEADDV